MAWHTGQFAVSLAGMTPPSPEGFVVAIDGPAGVGKSTAARGLAQRLGYTFLDTGALYRAVALVARERQVSWDDGPGLGQLVSGLVISFMRDGDHIRVLADGHDITDKIRAPEISDGSSRVSTLPEVRMGLLGLQRQLASTADVVAEGRDVGTVVFPNARAKFFLIASLDTRARRRTLELQAKGRPAQLAEVLAEMQIRDERDRSRALAPLRRADDALEIDTSLLTPEQVIDRMAEVVRGLGG
jgi:cytidylate kinase